MGQVRDEDTPTDSVFEELYQAYILQVQLAKRKNDKVPRMLWSLHPSYLRTLMDSARAHQYMSALQMQTIFGVLFVENRDQRESWCLYVLADKRGGA